MSHLSKNSPPNTRGAGIVDLRLYHGSSKPDLTALSIAAATPSHEYGPAIYLTDDRLVASCYTHNTGRIYNVAVTGSEGGVIDVDKPASGQHPAALHALERVERNFRRVPKSHEDVETRLYELRYSTTPHVLTAALVTAGVWMIQGHMAAMGRSGLCDRGIQYRVLCDKHCKIVDEANL